MSARFQFLEPATPALDVLIASGADNLFVIFGDASPSRSSTTSATK